MTVMTMELAQPAEAASASEPASADEQRWQQTAETAAASVAVSAASSARRVVLAYVGAGAYVLDGVGAIFQRGERLLSSAERRGAVMEHSVRQRFGRLEEQAVNEMRKLQDHAEENMQQLRDSRGGVNEEIEKRVELALANMGLPSRERLERLSQEIDALNQKLDEQILRLPAEPIPDQLG